MKTFSGSGFDKDKKTLIPTPPRGVSAPIQIDSLRERLNAGVTFGNQILSSPVKGVLF